jgi:hypothetical protein
VQRFYVEAHSWRWEASVHANAAECELRRESPKKIEESDVEVINLELSEEEKILLYSRCKPNFTEDA